MSDETFVIAVSGNGMKNAGISDGDLIRLKKADRAQDGDIVYAFVVCNGRESRAISRYREVDGEIRLCSETDAPNFAPFVRVSPSSLTILGIFQKVIKWI